MNNNEIFLHFLGNAVITREFELIFPVYKDVPARLPRRHRKKWRVVIKFIKRFGYRQQLDAFERCPIFSPKDIPQNIALMNIEYRMTLAPGAVNTIVQPEWKDLPAGISSISINGPLGQYSSQRIKYEKIILTKRMDIAQYKHCFDNDFIQRAMDQEMMKIARQNFITNLTITSR